MELEGQSRTIRESMGDGVRLGKDLEVQFPWMRLFLNGLGEGVDQWLGYLDL